MADAYIGLGSNLGDRERQLAGAVAALARAPGCRVTALSAVYETQPVGGPPQGAYLNAVAQLRTELAPRALLELLLSIEREAGRVRGATRDAARTLDLDLLLYGDRVIDEPELRVPHPRLGERAFALEPLAELAPGRLHPVLGESIATLASRVRDPAAVRRLAPGASLRPGRSRSTPPPARGTRMAIVAVSIAPLGAGTSVSRHVAAALRVVEGQDRVRYRLDPMFTTLEGPLPEIFELILRMQEAVFETGAQRVSSVIKVDERRDREVRMEAKVSAVEAEIGAARPARRGGAKKPS